MGSRILQAAKASANEPYKVKSMLAPLRKEALIPIGREMGLNVEDWYTKDALCAMIAMEIIHPGV